MSRIRTIKPEFWSSEQIVECSTNARLLFIGIWNFCDDFGRHSYSPKQLKGLIFPADDFATEDIRRMLDELSTNELITVYEVENKEYFQVNGWHHQKIDRKQLPKFPSPLDDNSTIIRRTFATEGKGREGNGSTDTNVSVTREDALSLSEEFEKEFWPLYPHKIGKGVAKRSFKAARRRVELQPLMDGLVAYMRTKPVSREWCNPSTWLNQDRWLDQPADANIPVPQSLSVQIAPFQVFIDADSSAGLAWWDYTFQKTGKYPPRNAKGGWYFPTEYPPREEAAG